MVSKSALRNREWRLNNPEKQILRGVKKRVREKGYEMNIELSDIVIPSYCPIFPWIKLELGGGDSAPTLDRIHNDLGYIKENVQVISYRANRMKSDGSLNELIALGGWAKSVLEN